MTQSAILKAYDLAKNARLNAYAKYSNFLVGACFKITGSEDYISGCNVENASFGATVCAERVAIWNWVSQHKKSGSIEFLVIVTDTENPVAGPCGMCLQVLSEFVKPETAIHLANLKGVQKTYAFKELLPLSFQLK